jgi:hypothetical protein
MVNVFETGEAAKNLVVVDALAVMVHEPAAVRETVVPETVQLPDAVKTTGVPDEDVAEIPTEPGIVCGEMVGKLMVCVTLTTLKFFGVRPAWKLPACAIDAAIEQVPADIPVTTPVAVSIRQTELGETARVTAPPDGAVAVKTKVESIGRSLILPGEITGSFAESADAASILCGDVAAVLSLSPTIFVAETLTV